MPQNNTEQAEAQKRPISNGMNGHNLMWGLIAVVVIVALGALWFSRDNFPLPKGESVPFEERDEEQNDVRASDAASSDSANTTRSETTARSSRSVLVTDGVKHSIPLDEILSGGPGKDGIPSIDDPKFISASSATFLDESDPGLGLTVQGESRFYPYRILVWHEIVNDTIAGEPVLVTYCPLCATGIVFERRVDGLTASNAQAGEVQEFGVSGMLWQSNLLMYNRAENEKNESLWSQVLGEAVLGVHTGAKLPVVRSDVVRFGDWKKAHPDTLVLSRETGAARDYGRDPYGSYYTSESVSFGATFTDTRLHPKALVHGIEIDGAFKAYHDEALPVGTITDTFEGKEIAITKAESGELSFTADGAPLTSIPGFWFSWLAVHPHTSLFTAP